MGNRACKYVYVYVCMCIVLCVCVCVYEQPEQYWAFLGSPSLTPLADMGIRDATLGLKFWASGRLPGPGYIRMDPTLAGREGGKEEGGRELMESQQYGLETFESAFDRT